MLYICCSFLHSRLQFMNKIVMIMIVVTYRLHGHSRNINAPPSSPRQSPGHLKTILYSNIPVPMMPKISKRSISSISGA